MDTQRTVLTAAYAMQRNVFVLTPEQQVLDAVQVLLQRGISGAPVVVDGKVVGMFSERDSLTALSSAHYDGELPGTIAQHMRSRFETVAPTTDLYEVASRFRESSIRRLPVVAADGTLLGLISRGDVLRALHRQFQETRPKNSYERIQEHLDAHLSSER